MEILIPNKVQYILDALENAGHESYIVGGCVRDSIMGQEPNDWDICTSAKPDEIKSAFIRDKIIETGLKHGTLTLHIDGENFEITTYRIDGKYTDGRHPDIVEFTDDLIADLSRRDFTINAMAYNPKIGLVDPFFGNSDISQKRISCVGRPEMRFEEDALRILRGLRFASIFGFDIEPETRRCMVGYAQRLRNISMERIRSELTKMLSSEIKCDESILMLLFDCLYNVDHEICYENHTAIAQRLLLSPVDAEIRLAHLFDTRKAKDVGIEKKLKKFRFDNVTSSNSSDIWTYGNKILRECATVQDIKYYAKNILRDIGYENAIKANAFAFDATNEPEVLQAIQDLYNIITFSYLNDDCYLLSDLNINGDDVINLGARNKSVGIVLNKLLELVMKEEIPNEFCVLESKAKDILAKNI